ncbi:L-rhamnose mutarotase [Hymenobacter sp. BT175]|uniref:L-rhamnose mutarotase n=1 Tax=Hymenobacter translucens TaxID=2886507 RepID=UPI001D0E83E9|nr:L-rhamnose mutarotase [Hymenobacter translucens]MCC2547460.1 L-rhamnose mutarotase [Hymenobacter translucens]
MEEVAFLMQLRPSAAAEYRRRHDALWPELAAALREAGIRDYSIFLDPDSGRLFAVQKRLPGHTTAGLPATAVMRRWWTYMADLMDTNADHSPWTQPLERVFHLE